MTVNFTATTPEGFPPPVQRLVQGNANDVREPSRAVQDMMVNWLKVTSLLGGTKKMREAASIFLPKWNREEPNDYAYRLKTTVLFNCFGHTVDGLGGKPFVRPLGWTSDMEPRIAAWFPNIDLTGRSFHVFAQEVFKFSLAYGMSHVLVDYPVTAGKVRTLAEEKAMGARPYLIHIKANQILGWRSTVKNGGEVLTQVRILENVEEDDGPFATRMVEQVRVLEPGKWTTYRLKPTPPLTTFVGQASSSPQEWAVHEEGETTLDFIPLVTFYARRTGFMTADSPLIDIADINIQHWQVGSDMYSVLHTASVPILTVTGVEKNDDGSAPLEVGAKSALLLPSGAEAKFTEHTGKAVASAVAALAAMEEQMRLLGAELLVKKPGQATATQATLDTSQQRSELQAITGTFEDTLDQVINVMAQWAKITSFKGNMQVYDDFLLAADDAVQEALMFSITTAGLLSQQSFYEAMQRRNVYDTDRPWEEEQERIKAQPLPQPSMLKPGMVQTPKTASSSVLAQLND
jgi:hypothetical protein